MAIEHCQDGRILGSFTQGRDTFTAADITDGSYAAVSFTNDSGDEITEIEAGSFASLSYDVDTIFGTVDVKCQYRNHSDGAWIDLQEDLAVSVGSLYAGVIRGSHIRFQMKNTGGPISLSFCLK